MAEVVMKWEVVTDKVGIAYAVDDAGGKHWLRRGLVGVCWFPDEWIEDSWEVVEKFLHCERITMEWVRDEQIWWVCIVKDYDGPDDWWVGTAPALPLAICRAALKALT